VCTADDTHSPAQAFFINSSGSVPSFSGNQLLACLLALKGCWLMVRSGLTMIRINRRQQQWVTREVVTAISFYGIQIIELFFFVLQMRCGHMLFFLLTSASGIRFSASFFFLWCFRLLLSQVRCTGRKLTTCSVLFRWSFFLSFMARWDGSRVLARLCLCKP
jgi:hypothetical protein